jgi:hypothetical protein
MFDGLSPEQRADLVVPDASPKLREYLASVICPAAWASEGRKIASPSSPYGKPAKEESRHRRGEEKASSPLATLPRCLVNGAHTPGSEWESECSSQTEPEGQHPEGQALAMKKPSARAPKGAKLIREADGRTARHAKVTARLYRLKGSTPWIVKAVSGSRALADFRCVRAGTAAIVFEAYSRGILDLSVALVDLPVGLGGAMGRAWLKAEHGICWALHIVGAKGCSHYGPDGVHQLDQAGGGTLLSCLLEGDRVASDKVTVKARKRASSVRPAQSVDPVSEPTNRAPQPTDLTGPADLKVIYTQSPRHGGRRPGAGREAIHASDRARRTAAQRAWRDRQKKKQQQIAANDVALAGDV